MARWEVAEVLETQGLIKHYRKRRVVDRVSVRVDRGEIVGLLGPNGAGKTTTFHMIVGLVRPDAGQILLDGEKITRLPVYRRARRGIGYLAQEASIFRKLSVEDNVRAVADFLPVSRRERKQKVEEVLAKLDIGRVRKSMGYQLSGGERRRAEIARALVMNPSHILLDEPFAGVDPRAVEEIQEIVLALKRMNLGVLITDHNVRETLEITDHAYIMHQGEILISGGTDDLVDNREAREIYLGERFRM
jgi:lipopolysaccharide export system ATP-binding protein